MINILKEFLDITNSIMKNKMLKMINTFAVAIKSVADLVQKEMVAFKKKLIQIGIVFILCLTAFLSLVLGFGFFIESKISALKDGLGFMAIGVLIFIITLIYLLVSKK